MQRLYSLLILIFASSLVGCIPSADAKSLGGAQALTKVPALMETPEMETVSSVPPASCPITMPQAPPFRAPEPYPAQPPERYENQFWYGTPELWTMLGTDATWHSLPHNEAGYSQKVFWWSQDFRRDKDPYPAFTLTIERLDMPSAPIVVSEKATNASADFGTAMLTGVAIPELGCWEITGKYKDAELSFVVWVTR